MRRLKMPPSRQTFCNLIYALIRRASRACSASGWVAVGIHSRTNAAAQPTPGRIYLPGAGWKGFDPTSGEIAVNRHIPVAVARLPEAVSPVAGGFWGPGGANLSVGVWVSELSGCLEGFGSPGSIAVR